MQPSQPNVYGLNCVRCGSALELPADPNVVHCNCPFCGLDNVLPQEIINARRPQPVPETRVVIAHTELRTQVESYNTFLADPWGGALWEQALRDHPALRAGIAGERPG